MKHVIIIIRPGMYFQTKQALIDEGFFSSTIKNVLGRGKKRVDFVSASDNQIQEWDVSEHKMIAKKMLEISVRDADVDRLIETIVKINKSSNSGDGKIIIIPLEKCIRIRTGETGEEALV